MPLPVGDVLAAHRKEVISSVLDMVPADRRRECQRLLADLELTIEAIAGRSKKYADAKNAIEAVMRYLEEKKYPATEKEIADALIGGGYRGGSHAQYSRITASINVHINGRKKIRANNPLKKVNGLIGPESWPDTDFIL